MNKISNLENKNLNTKNRETNIELENLELYKQIVEHMTESIWIWDNNNNSIYINSIFCNITWYSQEEIIWKNYTDFLLKNSSKNIKQIQKIKKTIRYETKLKTKNWHFIPVLCSWTSTKNWWTVLTISDLSELESLKQAEINLKKINKTKDEFVSIVWHELRTPLTSIRWYLSMILDWDMWEINSEVRKSLNHTYDSSIRLIKLVNDVLSIWKIESWKMEYYMKNVKIIDIVNSVHRDIDLEIRNKKIDFKIKIDKELSDLYINTDEDKLKQVFLNLLTNSLKFTPEKWKIIFKISKINNYVRFEIIDTWIWIPKDKIILLFNKFSQVESSMQRQNDTWLWLWLAICKNFINEFGSDIKVSSEVWKWSNFYFDLELND